MFYGKTYVQLGFVFLEEEKRRRAVGVFWSRKIDSGFSFREQFFCSRREAVLFLCSVVLVQEK